MCSLSVKILREPEEVDSQPKGPKMKSIAKNFLKSKSFANAFSKRHFNEISAQTIIDPTFGLSDEDKQLQEGDFFEELNLPQS